MSSIDSAINMFRHQLSELKNNSLPQIKQLTKMAQILKNSAHQVVEPIENHLNVCAPVQKLPVIYLVDSIMKNVNGRNEYSMMFSRKIIGMFELVFVEADQKTRQSLYRLRFTWGSTGRFLPSKLYALDLKINKIDEAWPLVTSKTLYKHPEATVSQAKLEDDKENARELKRKASEPASLESAPKLQRLAPNFNEISSILDKVRAQAPSVCETEVKEEMKTYVFSLLRSLQKSGFLKPSATLKPQAPSPIFASTDFSIGALKTRKSSVVNSLVAKRSDTCKYCCLKLDDSKGKSRKYKDHMDYHVQQNLGNFSKSGAPHRQWYPTASSWLTSKPVITVTVVTSTVQNPNLGVESTGILVKDCSVCNEQFQEYYDDDEDTWRFKDTVMVKNMIVHNACKSDAQNQSTDTKNFNFLDSIKKERCSMIDFGAF